MVKKGKVVTILELTVTALLITFNIILFVFWIAEMVDAYSYKDYYNNNHQTWTKKYLNLYHTRNWFGKITILICSLPFAPTIVLILGGQAINKLGKKNNGWNMRFPQFRFEFITSSSARGKGKGKEKDKKERN